MKKLIIFIISVIILLALFLCRHKYFVTSESTVIRVNRITGSIKTIHPEKYHSVEEYDFSGIE